MRSIFNIITLQNCEMSLNIYHERPRQATKCEVIKSFSGRIFYRQPVYGGLSLDCKQQKAVEKREEEKLF